MVCLDMTSLDRFTQPCTYVAMCRRVRRRRERFLRNLRRGRGGIASSGVTWLDHSKGDCQPPGGGGITVEAFDAYKQEMNALVAAAQEISDAVTGTATTWSSSKITAELAAI